MESPIIPDKTPEHQPKVISAGSFMVADIQKLPKLNLATFAKLVMPLAIEVSAKTGIVPLVPVAQAAHESASGNSGLARNHANLFGITAGDKWLAAGNVAVNLPTFENVTISEDSWPDYEKNNPKLTPKLVGTTTDKQSGKPMVIVEIHLPRLFREYKSWRDSFFDWGRLISTVAPYREAYTLLQKPETALPGIERMGLIYATDHEYAKKLVAVYQALAT